MYLTSALPLPQTPRQPRAPATSGGAIQARMPKTTMLSMLTTAMLA